MKRQLLFILLTLISGSVLYSQSQLENASFEEWEPEDTQNPKFEPVDWSSLKTSDWDFAAGAAPIVMDRSEDAHTGNYSIHLINVYNSLIDYVAPGMVTNGRVHVDKGLDLEKSTSFTDVNDSRWNTPLTKRPDSVVGWYKCKPFDGDFPTVKVVLHQDSSSIPNADSATWVAMAYIELSSTEVSTWTRFSTPFEYYNNNIPEYALSILTSGNGLSAAKNSEAWFDDLELVYNGTDISEKTAAELQAYYARGEMVVNINEHNPEQAELNVIDLNGRNVYTGSFDPSTENRYRLDLPAGVYIVQVVSGRTHLSKKIIIR